MTLDLEAIITLYRSTVRSHLNNRAELAWYIQTMIDGEFANAEVVEMGAAAAAEVAAA